MRVQKIFMFIISIIVFLVIGLSCDSSYHLSKAIDKGYNLSDEIVVVKVHGTIKGEDGKDSLIVREVEIPCPEIELPATRWRTRFDNKRFKDSLRFMRKIYNDSLDNSLKVLKADNKMLGDSLKEIRKMNKSNNKTEVKTTRIEKRR